MAILETKDLRKIYGSGENEVHALDGVSISVEEGEFVAVIGTSGSGKSTLLNMIGGLDRPTSGSVTIRGKELLKMKDEELTIFRRRNIGFVFQNFQLLPGETYELPKQGCINMDTGCVYGQKLSALVIENGTIRVYQQNRKSQK